MVRASLIRKLESIDDPKLRDVLISFLEEAERIIGETVTRKEFQEFVKATNENFEKVWKAINELAEAQKKTEERVKELAEAQKRTEERVSELEKSMKELAEAQKRTEQRVNELAEAQKKTEEKLEKLIGEHRKTREHLGGLSNAFGYVLEDRAIKGLPDILRKRFDIEITEPLKRDFIETPDGKEIELNIIGKGRRDGREVIIVGESKSQMRKRDIDTFLNRVRTLETYLPGEKLLVMISYYAPVKVRKYAEEKGVILVFSYELPLA